MEAATNTGPYSYLAAARPSAWPAIAGTLMVGYLCLSRTFAYVGIPPWKVFVSEVVLALFFFWGPKVDGASWLFKMTETPALKRFSIVYSIFFIYGVLQVLRGITGGNPPFTAIRDLTFNYYPLYFFLGLCAGVQRPDLLPKLLRGFAWFNGIYGVLYLLLLNRAEWVVPGVSDEISPVPIFGQPMYSFVALLGLIAYEKELWRSWHLLALNAFIMLGMQIRTEWLAFVIGMITLAIVTRHAKRLLRAMAILSALFCLMYITDFSIPGPEGRGGGDISIRKLTDRAIAPFRANTSDTLTAAGIAAESQEATFVWRTVWWLLIWSNVHSTLHTAVLGFGYGYPLGDLAPYLTGDFIRTPHNEFFYALGYTGWTGVIFFFLFQSELLRLLWRANRVSSDPFGVPYWVAMMAFGMFFPLGETPYGAIPFYLIAGWLAAPVLWGKPSMQQTYRIPEVYFPHASTSAAI